MKKPKTRKIDLQEEASRHKIEQSQRAVKASLDQILWAIKETYGFPYEVASLLKVSVATVHRWMDQYPEVRKAMELRMLERRHRLVSDALDAAHDPKTKNRLGWNQHAIALIEKEEAAIKRTMPDDDDGDDFEVSYSVTPPRKRPSDPDGADDTLAAESAPSPDAHRTPSAPRP